MAGIEEEVKMLLNGEIVPVNEMCISGAETSDDYVPLVKRTVSYIVMALVFDDQGRVLLIQEAKERIRGLWYIPAGRVEPDENLIDGVKREVLEEAGLEIDPISFCCLEMYGSLSWYRFVYVAKPSGGKLKTLAEQDDESLQAQWFTVDEIMNGGVKLRGKDFFKTLSLARDYLLRPENKRHPPYQIGIQPHNHLLLRPLIIKQTTGGATDVLCCKRKGTCLPVVKLRTTDHGLSIAVMNLFREAFNMSKSDSDLWLDSMGLLTLEHCGIPSREHDGICISVVYVVPESKHAKVSNVPNKDFGWHSTTDKSLLEQIHKRIFCEHMLVSIVG